MTTQNSATVSLAEWLYSFFGEPVCKISVDREASGDSVNPATVEQTDTGVRFKTESGRAFEITVREINDEQSSAYAAADDKAWAAHVKAAATWPQDEFGREIDPAGHAYLYGGDQFGCVAMLGTVRCGAGKAQHKH